MTRLIAVVLCLCFSPVLFAEEPEASTMQASGNEKIFTVNTDPLVMLLGFYYITLDVKFTDHFIWGNALMYQNGRLCLLDAMKNDYWGIGYTIGLAWFPFDPESKGFHLALFYSSMAMFDATSVFYSPAIGAYAGYSFHFFETIKLSLKLGGLYTLRRNFTEFPKGDISPHVSFEIGIMF
jgi:hypothetical protein